MACNRYGGLYAYAHRNGAKMHKKGAHSIKQFYIFNQAAIKLRQITGELLLCKVSKILRPNLQKTRQSFHSNVIVIVKVTPIAMALTKVKG